MRYLSICSGIEAATQAWAPLGWRPVAFSEIEPFPCAVLAHHYPGVPNWGDMTRYQEWPDADVDVLCGGTPCQSFSVAGLRKGMGDPRGNLALVYLGVADRYRPRWLVWENVPGVLSSNGGRDFGAFLGGLGELGYGWSYRVLDAQYVRTRRFPCAVPQRRRRVFVVGYLGDWRRAAAVLFDRQSLRGDPAPSRRAREGVAWYLSPGAHPGGFNGQDAYSGQLIPFDTTQISSAANYSNPKPGDACHPLAAGAHPPAVGFTPFVLMERGREGGSSLEYRQDGTANAILTPNGGRGGLGVGAIAVPWAVRRLTPRECERLMGFPDDFTLIPWRGRPAEECPDGPRYKALGNSWAVNVAEWIGERIAMVDRIGEPA